MEWGNNPNTYVAVIAGLGFLGGLIVFGHKASGWVHGKNQLETNFDKFLIEIREKFDYIVENIPSSTSKGSSPVTLNELGEKVSRELEVKDWAKKEAQELKSKIDHVHPYEIQQFCRNYIRSEFAPPEETFSKMKQCAFDNGIPFSGVQEVFALELRDALLPLLKD